MSLTKINVYSTVIQKLTFTLLLFLNFGQTQPIKDYSPRKLIFYFYGPPTFSVILQYNSVILQSQIRSSLFGHLNNS